jgi:hypothetical protein
VDSRDSMAKIDQRGFSRLEVNLGDLAIVIGFVIDLAVELLSLPVLEVFSSEVLN